jgi:acetyl esterase
MAIDLGETRLQLAQTGRLRATAPHPSTQVLLRRMGRVGGLRPGMPVEVARRGTQLMIAMLSSREQVESARQQKIPGPGREIEAEIYTPRSGSVPRPALVWFHGGGFVTGDLLTASGTARALANRTGAVVISVAYRRAPEHTLDDAYDDGLAAVRWVARSGQPLGVDVTRIGVGGDSAGGNIAAVVALEHRAEAVHPLALQLLVYAAFDMPGGGYPSRTERMGGLIAPAASEWFRSRISRATDPRSRRYAPVLAADLTGLPPTIVVTAGFDPLRDEGLAYYDRLRAADVPSQLFHFPDDIHGFLSFDLVLHNGRRGLDEVGDAAGEVLGVPTHQRPLTAVLAARWGMPAQRHQVVLNTLGLLGNWAISGGLYYPRRVLRVHQLACGGLGFAKQITGCAVSAEMRAIVLIPRASALTPRRLLSTTSSLSAVVAPISAATYRSVAGPAIRERTSTRAIAAECPPSLCRQAGPAAVWHTALA